MKGFLDAHTHISAYDFLGGKFHCGKPWSPYGVTVALQDCPDHEPNGAAAVAENFFVTGTPVIDIKPYFASTDAFAEATIAGRDER